MELREIFQIIRRRIILLIVIVALSLGGTYYFTKNATDKYESSSILTVQANRENTEQYQYGGYYSIQASDLFINTILGWIKSPNLVTEIYKKSDIPFDETKIKSLGKKIYARKVPPQNIVLNVTHANKGEAEKLTTSTIGLIKERTGQLALVGNSSTNFEIIGSDPIITTISPNLPFNSIIAFIVSVILSLLAIFLIEYWSPTINSIQKARNTFKRSPISMKDIKLRGLANSETKEAEKFRFLRANISGQEEGKTSIIVGGLNEQMVTPLLAANLALSFARAGKKTILVDACFANPTIHDYFGKQNDFGFSEFLFDEDNIEKYIQKTEEKNLQIVSAGMKLSYASDTIERAEIKKILKELETKSDVIIISVPPLNASSEAFPLFSIIKRSLLVVKIGKTSLSAASYVNSFFDKKDVEKNIVII